MKKLLLGCLIILVMVGVMSLTPKMERGKDTYYGTPVVIDSEQKTFDLPRYTLHFNEVTAGTITASVGGNWSATTTWVGGVLPAATDDVALSSFTVVWDVGTIARIPATGTLGTITAATTGTITADISNAACHTSGACSINFTTAAAGTEHLFQITGATDHDVTFNGTSITASAATAAKHGIYHNSNGGTANVNCALIGSSGNTGVGIKLDATGSKVIVAGDITGGAGAGAYGVQITAGATQLLTVNSGTITGSNASTATPGIYNGNTTQGNAALVVNSGVKLVNGTKAGAIAGAFTWNAGVDDYWTIAGTVTRVAKEVAAADLKTGVKNGTITGTLATGGGAWGF